MIYKLSTADQLIYHHQIMYVQLKFLHDPNVNLNKLKLSIFYEIMKSLVKNSKLVTCIPISTIVINIIFS